jgi:glycogen debranching enzyme
MRVPRFYFASGKSSEEFELLISRRDFEGKFNPSRVLKFNSSTFNATPSSPTTSAFNQRQKKKRNELESIKTTSDHFERKTGYLPSTTSSAISTTIISATAMIMLGFE